MTTLIDFLEARLAEDESAANKAGGREWTYRGHVWLIVDHEGEPVVYEEGKPNWFQASHIVRHDPARVLREVQAKRALLAEHAPKTTTWIDEPDTLSCGRCGTWNEYPVDFPCATLRALAAIYSDHPDYRKEWAA